MVREAKIDINIQNIFSYLKKDYKIKSIIERLFFYNEKYKILDIFLYVGIIFSLHYASYIASFDIQLFLLIDSSSIVKYFFQVSILYILIYGLIIIGIKFFNNYFSIAANNIWSNSVSNLLNNKIFIFILQISLFSYYYVGQKYFWIPFLLSVIMGLIFLINDTRKVYDWNNKYEYSIKVIFQHSISKFQNYNQDKKLWIEIFLTILLILSVTLGAARAAYVKDNFTVTIGKNKIEYILFSSNDVGVILYKNDKVIFYPWNNIPYITFSHSPK